jgi:hypothetical protein
VSPGRTPDPDMPAGGYAGCDAGCGAPPYIRHWPDPTPEMLADPMFEAIWQCIKSWDINVPHAYSGYMGATGNHARAIYDAISGDLYSAKQVFDEYPYDDERFNKGVQHVVHLLSKTIGAENWYAGDGSAGAASEVFETHRAALGPTVEMGGDARSRTDVETIASLMYEAANPTMKWSYLWPSYNHLHARVRQQYIEAAARFQDNYDGVAQRKEHSEPDEGRKDVGSTPIAIVRQSNSTDVEMGGDARAALPVAKTAGDDPLAGLDERLDRLLLTASDNNRFVLSTESAKNIVGIVREWIRSKGGMPSADARAAVIEECAHELETSYPDHAWLNAACAAIRALAQASATKSAPVQSDDGRKV